MKATNLLSVGEIFHPNPHINTIKDHLRWANISNIVLQNHDIKIELPGAIVYSVLPISLAAKTYHEDVVAQLTETCRMVGDPKLFAWLCPEH